MKGVSPRPADRSIITASSLTLGRNMSHKGVSPLIAGVLLVVFTVAVAGIVVNFMASYTEETAEAASEASLAVVDCALERASIDRVWIDTYRGTVKALAVTGGDSDVIVKSVALLNSSGGSCVSNMSQVLVKGGQGLVEANCSVFSYDCSDFDRLVLTSSCGRIYTFELSPSCTGPSVVLSGNATGVTVLLVEETDTSYVYSIEVRGEAPGYADIAVWARNASSDRVYKNESGVITELNETPSDSNAYILERDEARNEITLRVHIGDPIFIISSEEVSPPAGVQGLFLLSNGRASDVIEFSAAGWNDSLSLNLSNTSSIITAGLDVTGLAREGGVRDDWWNSSWDYRQAVNISNNAGSTLEDRYTVSTSFDLTGCVNDGRCNASGDDVRLVWEDDTPWWNSSWDYRKKITVRNENNSQVLEEGYTVSVNLDTTGPKFTDNGNDTRIVWWNGD